MNIRRQMSRIAAKDSFATTWLMRRHDADHGLQPWLRSAAANAAENLIGDSFTASSTAATVSIYAGSLTKRRRNRN